ncbi:hypothetical protein LCGC14_0226170 [marine sediment metagenome]|uniref:Acetyl xylan esterase domain-containing protein n=1 Tax=marine sediment metagenome TaxID=412755 RepID=A0A0F9UG75_9ZZZZ|nr:hypothetical protein [Phycisphaerae bacterium]HDZ45292.1 hypothetical protein [Phycisphaerae bacterium]
MAKTKPTLHLSTLELHRHLMATKPPAMSFRGRTKKHVAAWQRKLRGKLKMMLGWDNLPRGKDRCPLKVRSLWKRQTKLGTIEKIVFTAEPKSDVPGYICLPAKGKPPYNWFICVQGHSTGVHNSIAVDFKTNTRRIKVEGEQDFAIGCMERGIAALCIEQRAFGERWLNYPKYPKLTGSCSGAATHALQLGRTLIGERVFDVDRGIDLLATRKDVRMNTLGLMGLSGGGTITTFASALLSRLKMSMPAGYFCTFKDSIMAMPHCGCNYVPGLLTVAEMADVLGLFAPKPVVVVTGKDDPIFPIRGVRSEFRRLQGIYKAAGAPDNCKLVVGDGEHQFFAEQGWKAMFKVGGL